MKSKKFNVGLLVSAIALALSGGAMASESQSGATSDELEQDLRVRLRNELRMADRPSACGSDPDAQDCKYGNVEAWVQGVMVDYETSNLSSWFDVEAYSYSIHKLMSVADDATSRAYLDANDESFNLLGGSVNLKPVQGLEIKLGRWGTDYAYGSMDHIVPLLEYSSVRTMPSMKEGGLVHYEATDTLDFYGAVTTKTAGGFDTAWKDDAVNGKHTPRYHIGVVYDAPMYAASFGARYQEDDTYQLQSNLDYAFVTDSDLFVKFDGRIFYGQTIGYTKENQLNDVENTYVASTQITIAKGQVFGVASFGQVGDKITGSSIDTDIVFPFDMSIARNGHNTTSWQVGGGYNFNENWSSGLFIVKTDGDLDSYETTVVDGIGANLTISHKFTSGQLKGLKSSLVLNKAEEDQTGEKAGQLDYYDIKFAAQYDFNFFQ
ncbi:OprD family outer membrane porin [Enterovibrio sp. ZSDZ42]|uniref:OprD family outer membrane porin n=1 Tax=Enterovibrio gelatinilyticus TaxID=2899819 RepID=A0ABT5R5D5_9GAMM|nr:OprD family outer membrane porin [Enterovibrio sp. ZSDZ42]MDD1795489.1 OprD family outer membrane porin [Enterovibrio sp. ZSDZ42]